MRIDCTKQDLYSKNYLYTESLSYTSDREIMESYYELLQENKIPTRQKRRYNLKFQLGILNTPLKLSTNWSYNKIVTFSSGKNLSDWMIPMNRESDGILRN